MGFGQYISRKTVPLAGEPISGPKPWALKITRSVTTVTMKRFCVRSTLIRSSTPDGVS